MSEGSEETKTTKPTEKDKLIKEKIELAKKIGIWGTHNPVEGYTETPQHARIEEIDLLLSEIENG